MGMPCRNALLALAIVAAVPLAARADTTTLVRNVSGVTVIMGGVAVPRAQRRTSHIAARSRPRSSARVALVSGRPAENAPAGLRGAARLLRTALDLLGKPYVWGGASPRGFDCSGFTSYVFGRLGIVIPRTADVQFADGRSVREPLPGDLVFFQTYDYGASHVGIYLGDGRFVNAIGADVHVTTFASEYFRSRYLGARRFLPETS